MDEQRQGDQLEPTYSSSVVIQNVEKDGEKGSGISVLMVQHDDIYIGIIRSS